MDAMDLAWLEMAEIKAQLKNQCELRYKLLRSQTALFNPLMQSMSTTKNKVGGEVCNSLPKLSKNGMGEASR